MNSHLLNDDIDYDVGVNGHNMHGHNMMHGHHNNNNEHPNANYHQSQQQHQHQQQQQQQQQGQQQNSNSNNNNNSNSNSNNNNASGEAGYSSRSMLEQSPGAWDVFLTSPQQDDDETAESRSIEVILKFLKAITYVLTFCVVLGCAALSKSIVLLMASMIRPRKVVTICNQGVPGLERDKHYQTQFNLDDPERVSWIWAMLFVLMAPEVFTLFRSARMCIFKSYRWPTPRVFWTVITFESLHVIGVVLIVYVALPALDVVRGVMLTSCICILPGTFSILSRNRQTDHAQWGLKLSADVLALLAQFSALIIWPWKHYQDTYNPFAGSKVRTQHELETLLIPVAILLASFGWWENYVKPESGFKFIRKLAETKEQLKRTRYFTYMFVSIWKIMLMFATMVAVRFMIDGQIRPIFANFKLAFSQHSILITKVKGASADPQAAAAAAAASVAAGGAASATSAAQAAAAAAASMMAGIDDDPIYLTSHPNVVIYAICLQIISAWLCYVFGKFACRICIQRFSFAFGLILVVPVTLSLLIAACGIHFEDRCNGANQWLPTYLFWTCHRIPFMSPSVGASVLSSGGVGSDASAGSTIINGFTNIHAIMWLVWLMSQAWITVHIWMPRCERLATTDKLFVNPMYCGALIDQSLALSRRRDEEVAAADDNNNNGGGNSDSASSDPMSASSLANQQDSSQHYETISEHLGSTCEPNGAAPTAAPNSNQTSSGGKKGSSSGGYGSSSTVQSSDHTTRIYACATMWHETVEEMTQMLKSVLRMDEDQSARRNAREAWNIIDPDYYEFEVHIFFDDAFELSDDDDEQMQVNRFVKQLLDAINIAAKNVHQCDIRLRPPKKYPTPYGGRLEWTMPGQNKLIAHLKDKIKIRHRKRWSQVMYMYYLLGHRLMALPIDVQRKSILAENTYILTLDGDINFRPQAVQLLVDLMKKNRNLGAACGRIHPVGSGPMVWYQKFEYAIGHWLHKSTEHMFGCVLCSPGCFSLFRAKALMEDNVMRKYTTKSEEASHYVQYDQGEDRWLCTLLLQRGFRVEYSAASDAYTHCPEGFGEFYTQRRRWAPSTMANIMDLLGEYKRTVAVNDSISLPYIIYQAMLMLGTVLGPGTIFLMLVGAFNAVFHISNWDSFVINIIPILFFVIVCFSCPQDMQILFAQILSAGYALLMMAVFVGTAIQMIEDSVLSPTNIFFLSLLASFFIAALAHPQEFSCFYPIVLYLLCVPSMYLLLMIYSLINLNVVTWGTREVQQKKTKAELEELKRQEEEAKKQGPRGSLMALLNKRDDDNEEGSISFNLANLVKCMFCTYPKPNEEKLHLIHIDDSINKIDSKLQVLMSALNLRADKRPTSGAGANRHSAAVVRYQPASIMAGPNSAGNAAADGASKTSAGAGGQQQQRARGASSRQEQLAAMNDDMNQDDDMDDDMDDELDDDDMDAFDSDDHLRGGGGGGRASSAGGNKGKVARDDLRNPYWIEDKDLKEAEQLFLPESESKFWTELIEKYLYPLDSNKEQQARIASDLKELRNRVVFAIFMINAIFILAVFLLQLHKDIIHVDWPFGAKVNATINPDTGEVTVKEEKLEMEPIGLVFVFFFAFILIIQFLGMIFHRFGTLSHILASVELFSKKSEETTTDEFLEKNFVQIARDLQRLRGIDEDDKSDDSKYGVCGNAMTSRNIVARLDRRVRHPHRVGTLDVAFKKRFEEWANNAEPSRGLNTPVLGGRRRRELATAIARRGMGGGGGGAMGGVGGGLMELRQRQMNLGAGAKVLMGPGGQQMGSSNSNRRMQTLGRANALAARGTHNRNTLDRGRPINGANQMQGHDNAGYNMNGSFIMLNHFDTTNSTGGQGVNGGQNGDQMMQAANNVRNGQLAAAAAAAAGQQGDPSSAYLRNVMSEDL